MEPSNDQELAGHGNNIPIGSMYGVYMIYAYIWLIFMVNVGKYTSPMDPMGFWDQNVGIPIASIRWGSNFENAVGVSGRGRKN